MNSKNIFIDTVNDFGREWNAYDFKNNLPKLEKIFNEYFSEFPWDTLDNNSECTDLGCGSGRWSYFLANKVKKINCVDASADAISVAKRNLKDFKNIEFHNVSISDIPIKNNSQDFIFSLGVLHHLPDTYKAIELISTKLKKGKPLFLYLYYNFDNKNKFYYYLWYFSNLVRLLISRLPHSIKLIITQLIGISIYYPFAKTAYILNSFGINVTNFPLSYYSDKTLYVMMNDALDRFGTRHETRFSRYQIQSMLNKAGFEKINFKNTAPYWCVISFKK